MRNASRVPSMMQTKIHAARHSRQLPVNLSLFPSITPISNVDDPSYEVLRSNAMLAGPENTESPRRLMTCRAMRSQDTQMMKSQSS